ncbi:MAG TPA: hypothetical protein VFN88_11500 [Caulobacteraceae bacterium]|nr:hypothetical protein [Caulobacteraceae bacterium]
MSEEAPDKPARRASDRPAGAPIKPARDPAFSAQLITQGTIKRCLKGGKEVLDAARSSYLKTEWSGPADRRPPLGLLTKTKV